MAPAQWERIACISLPSLKVDSSGAPAESGAWSQHVQALDLSGMGLICDSGLPSSLSALVGLNYLGLFNNPDLFGGIPTSWSGLVRLSKCLTPSDAVDAQPALGQGDGSSDEFFHSTGFYCGLDVRDTSLCGGYPGDLALRSTPSALPPCACSTTSLATNHSGPALATFSYSPLCVMLLGYKDFCLKSKVVETQASKNYTLCPSPPPPSPPSPPPPSPPPSETLVCVEPADQSPVGPSLPIRLSISFCIYLEISACISIPRGRALELLEHRDPP